MEWKISQLARVFSKERIYVSTENEEYKKIARAQKVQVHDRDPRLAREREVTFHEVVDGIVEHIPHAHIAWCTVNSPLMSPKEYADCFAAYEEQVLGGHYDSLIGV